MGKVCMFLAYYYVVYFSEINEEIKRSRLGKVVEFFKVIGIIAGAIWSVISIVKELVLIPWAEWAHNGILEHIFGVLKGIIIFPACFFLMYVFHAFAMFGIHKLWPDDYDEYGHRRKFRQEGEES